MKKNGENSTECENVYPALLLSYSAISQANYQISTSLNYQIELVAEVGIAPTTWGLWTQNEVTQTITTIFSTAAEIRTQIHLVLNQVGLPISITTVCVYKT